MRVPLKLNFANPALFASGFVFLFFVPFLYPSYHFPYLKVVSPFVHFLVTVFIILLISGASQLSKIRIFHKNKGISPNVTPQFFVFSRLVILLSILMNVLIIANAIKAYDGNIETAKDSIGDFGGINIISQLYLLFLPPFIYYGVRAEGKYKLTLFLLGVVLLVRAGLMAERLAFLEFLIPTFITYIIASEKKLIFTKILKYFLMLLGFFMILELTRQFYNQYIVSGNSVDVWFAFTWTLERFFAYYADTANKFYFSVANDLGFSTYHYLTPFVRILNRITSVDFEYHNVNYGAYQWKDFTNPGGLTMLFTDYGWLSLVVFTLIFFVFFKSFRSINKGSLFALCLYPNLVTAILELPRFVTLYETRFFVPLVFFVVSYLIYKYLVSSYPIRNIGRLQIKNSGKNLY